MNIFDSQAPPKLELLKICPTAPTIVITFFIKNDGSIVDLDFLKVNEV
ncbi:MAG: hypothetical protein QMA99_06635 [Flavobacterium sp.]